MAYHVYILWMNRCFLNWMVRIFYMRDRDIQLFIYENIFYIYSYIKTKCLCVCVREKRVGLWTILYLIRTIFKFVRTSYLNLKKILEKHKYRIRGMMDQEKCL